MPCEEVMMVGGGYGVTDEGGGVGRTEERGERRGEEREDRRESDAEAREEVDSCLRWLSSSERATLVICTEHPPIPPLAAGFEGDREREDRDVCEGEGSDGGSGTVEGD